MPLAEQEARVAGIAETIRTLPDRWDDRRDEAYDCLPSEARAAIQRNRLDCLSTLGRLVIKAILDSGSLSDSRFVELEERANWARQLERTKPYERGAMHFLGMFVAWCHEHADLLPPGMPPFGHLNCHHSTFEAEKLLLADFARICEAIVWLLSAPASGVTPDNWLTVTEWATLLLKDVDGLDLKKARAVYQSPPRRGSSGRTERTAMPVGSTAIVSALGDSNSGSATSTQTTKVTDRRAVKRGRDRARGHKSAKSRAKNITLANRKPRW